MDAMDYAPGRVSKTVITVTVLHPADEPLPGPLDLLLEEMDSGSAVGQETDRVTTPVPTGLVKDELLALGNDGEFFTMLFEEE